REFDVQAGQPSKDPGLLVAEPPVARRTVVLLGEADVAQAVEDAFDAHAALGPSQGPARTGVGAAAEGDVIQGVLPVGAEVVWTLEPAGIAVGRSVEQHHRRPRLDLDAADGGGPKGKAKVGLHRALEAQRFL